jgi:serine/threonine-protein kinase HipA
VIEHRLLTRDALPPEAGEIESPVDLSPLRYLLDSDSDRIGALDFQVSATDYVPRTGGGTLGDLMNAAARLEAGDTFSPALDAALLRGSSIGGARPKALLDDHGRKLIAKFSSTTDVFPVVKAEALAMDLGQRVGLHIAPTELTTSMGREVLLVERFDRGPDGDRKMMVSALTILGLAEMEARYATYHDLADIIAERFTHPRDTLRELFARIVFNIAMGNTDDHARNHAAFWDGRAGRLTITPAYDICPYPRAGHAAEQIMAIGRDGSKSSQFATCIRAADVYGLSATEARDVVEHQVATIRREWHDAADAAQLTDAEQARMWEREILNPYAFFDQP